jgi:K+-transporting ATPase KdpF subunit
MLAERAASIHEFASSPFTNYHKGRQDKRVRLHFRRADNSLLRREHRVRGPVRPAHEVRWHVGIDTAITLLVSILTLGYLVLAMLKPEKF